MAPAEAAHHAAQQAQQPPPHPSSSMRTRSRRPWERGRSSVSAAAAVQRRQQQQVRATAQTAATVRVRPQKTSRRRDALPFRATAAAAAVAGGAVLGLGGGGYCNNVRYGQGDQLATSRLQRRRDGFTSLLRWAARSPAELHQRAASRGPHGDVPDLARGVLELPPAWWGIDRRLIAARSPRAHAPRANHPALPGRRRARQSAGASAFRLT